MNIVVGIWTISNPDVSMLRLTVIMAICFIVDGITEIGYSFTLISVGGGLYLFTSGIAGLILATLIFLKLPESSNYSLGIYLGIKLIFYGAMLSMAGYSVRKAA